VALELVQVNLKARDDAALGRFWAKALDWAASSRTPRRDECQASGFGLAGPRRCPFCVLGSGHADGNPLP
jgi:hypothetical protein